MPRCFVAIELTGEARATVADLLARLRAAGGDVAWARADQLHVTLRFLGAVEGARIAPLVDALALVAAAARPFVLPVTGTGAFPSFRQPRVLWVGVVSPALVALAAAVDAACANAGWPAEARPFHPHVSLGRVRERRRRSTSTRTEERADAAALAARVATAGDGLRVHAAVEELVLFQSILDPRGARHHALARLPLGAPRG